LTDLCDDALFDSIVSLFHECVKRTRWEQKKELVLYHALHAMDAHTLFFQFTSLATWSYELVICLTGKTSNLSKARETRDSLSSSSLQVVQVYLQPFWCSSLLKCVSQAEVKKNSRKPLFWAFKVIQGHWCW